MQSTLIRRIAREVSLKSDVGDVSPNLLNRWRSRWPWLVVLDGLDEVVDPTLRKRIVEQIDEFANDCEADDCDVLIVLTTRPLGFVEQIGKGLFEQVALADLNPRIALTYGEKVTSIRLAASPDRRDQVIRRLRDAAEDEAYENLLKTPLQVLILSIIVEQAGDLAPDRYSLFNGYFHTIMAREKGKPGGFSSLIRDYSPLIERIHHRVGIELQVRAEHASTTLSIISAHELRDIIWTELEEDEFDPASRDRQLLEDLRNAATHRLVLLAPRGEDGYGFDVRLLQEYMAGQYLTAAPDAVTADRLALTAAHPHWRQTWLFAAGKMFVQPAKHLQRIVVEITESIDDDAPQRLGRIFPVGPQLAMDILVDGMARVRPIWLKRLVERSLDIIETERWDPFGLSLAFVKVASANEYVGRLMADGLRARLGSPGSENISRAILSRWVDACEIVGAPLAVRAIAQVKPDATVRRVSREVPEVPLPQLSAEQLALFNLVMPTPNAKRGHIRIMRRGLEDRGVAQAIERALPARLHGATPLRRAVEVDVVARELRRPIGPGLLRDSD